MDGKELYFASGSDESSLLRENDCWERFSQWIHCICVVTFDLNLGQALELVYPPEFMPNEVETTNICYMAFPDSNSGCMGDTKFHMRLRLAPKANHDKLIEKYRAYNKSCTTVVRADLSHYWGFVYFRQKRDMNLPRGYFQKSFIIITHLPYFNLFYEIVGQLAPKYFQDGIQVLEEACKQINTTWPSLQPGSPLHLEILDTVFQISIPTSRGQISNITGNKTAAKDDECETSKIPTRVINAINELELYRSLNFVIENLYTLWELVLVAEPIVVFGTSPADCSHMVQTLVALIAPLEYCGEARPYFTIHDSEFKEFTRECGKTLPPVILGVTNPFFIKLLKNWPHMLRLIDNQINMQQLKKNAASIHSVTSFGLSNYNFVNNPSSSTSVTLNVSNDNSVQGLHTKYKPYLKKDKNLIKKVLAGMKTKRPDHVQTTLIRRHLLELTHSFMIPLERYMASLMPLQKDISPFKSAPNANAFKLDDFLATLEQSGPHLTSQLRGDWKGLYRRFFNSPNFRGWYESRYQELQLTLQDLQLQALTEANLEHWAQDKQEVEIIDMLLKLKQKLNLHAEKSNLEKHLPNNGGSNITEEQIRAQIHCVKEMLPHDLKNIVNI